MLTGRQIREARDRLGWKRSELARRAGLSLSAVNRAEASDGEAIVTTAQIASLRSAFAKAGEVLVPAEPRGRAAVTFLPNLAVLRLLTQVTHATVPAIGTACQLQPGEVLGDLSAMEMQGLIASRYDKDATPPRWVYSITAEGRRKAEA